MLGQRHQLLNIGAKLLRLGGGGRDLLMLDERGRHVAEQGRAVARGALKLTSADTMAHGSFSVRQGSVSGNPGQADLQGAAQNPVTFGEPRAQAEKARAVKLTGVSPWCFAPAARREPKGADAWTRDTPTFGPVRGTGAGAPRLGCDTARRAADDEAHDSAGRPAPTAPAVCPEAAR